MARTTVLGRLNWRAGQVREIRHESATARTMALDVPSWPGHLPGQHVDVRLTADDGYSTQRSYSIASAPDGTRVELTVERLANGEVSPYLTDVLQPGDPLELRGPIGGWFVWRPEEQAPTLLTGGGSGVVPLMAMIRTRVAHGSTTPMGRPRRAAGRQQARHPGLAARRPAGLLRVRPDRLRRGRRRPARRPGPRSAADQDRTVRTNRHLTEARHDPVQHVDRRQRARRPSPGCLQRRRHP